MADDPNMTVQTITAYREQIKIIADARGGHVVDSTGDNILIEFPAATSAAEAALEIQRVIEARNSSLPEERRMEFRIGLHMGEVLAEGDRIYGDGVNIAARLEGMADPTGVVCSAAVRDQLSGQSVTFHDLGERDLKNIPSPIRAFKLSRTAESTRATLDDTPAIAVLPFENFSSSDDHEYFADGITEDLITDLSKLPEILVTSRTSAFSYKGRRVRAEEIGRELGVGYILEGSVRRSADQVRVTAQLIDAATGKHLWAQRFDRELTSVFALQDELTLEIISALSLRLGVKASSRRDSTTDPGFAAYDLCLKGSWYLRRFDPVGVERARLLFTQATELDQNYALAWARLGDTYTVEHAFWAPDASTIQRGIGLIQKALKIAPDDPEAIRNYARALWFTGEFEESASHAERALNLQPGSGDGNADLSRSLRSFGDFDGAWRAADRAVRLDPLNEGAFVERAAVAYFLERYEEAIRDLDISTRLGPDYLPTYLMLAGSHAALGHSKQAAEAIEEILRLAPNYGIAFMQRQVPGADFEGKLVQDLRKAGMPE